MVYSGKEGDDVKSNEVWQYHQILKEVPEKERIAGRVSNSSKMVILRQVQAGKLKLPSFIDPNNIWVNIWVMQVRRASVVDHRK